MQRYSPIYDDPEGNLPAMQEDSEKGDWYHRADVDPAIKDRDERVHELEQALQSCVYMLGRDLELRRRSNASLDLMIEEAKKALRLPS